MGQTTFLRVATKQAGESSPLKAEDLAEGIRCGLAPLLIDIREPEACAAGRLSGSENVPDGSASALVRRLTRANGRAVLVCGDGRASAMAARTLRFCGFRDVTHLEGGMKAWIDQGRTVLRKTSSGRLREVRPCEESRDDRPGPVSSILQALNFRVISIAVMVSAWLLTGVMMVMK